MRVLGICGSHRDESRSGVHQLVRTVLENTGCDYDLVSLKGKRILGCTACLGCAHDNVCRVQDDMTPLRQLIVDADAFVIGAPNYYSTLNASTHAFLERWYQFRHREGDTLWGKLAVSVGVGGTSGRPVVDDMDKFFLYNFVEPVAKVDGQGAASCFSCGYGETCKVGIPAMLFGPGARITEDMIPNVGKQPALLGTAVAAGKQLGERLRNGHDRQAVAQAMQARLMAMFMESV
ncbi:MAG: NADPH-dependent reductase [Holophagaceae bacterium]|nr:NADPH-dependent reductase [Holophagaceae bacterium]